MAQRLPKTAVSVEAWFTAEEEEISTAGLVGVLQDAPGCALGWSLTFDRKKAVPVTDEGTSGTCLHMRSRSPCRNLGAAMRVPQRLHRHRLSS